KAFDVAPILTTWLDPIWIFPDRLMNGEAGKGYVYAKNPDGLVVVVGTSYTGQYTWIPEPVGFTWQIGLHMQNVEIQNRPVAGLGSFYAFDQFMAQRQAIAADFVTRNGDLPRVLVWEFPIRDIEGIARATSDG